MRTPSAEQKVIIAGLEETLFTAFVGAQTKSGVSLSVLEQKFGWAVGLSTSASHPSSREVALPLQLYC